MALIEFRDVKKRFGPKIVFDGLNMDIHEGETLTVIGGSGQGKSVMLKLLIGLLPVDSGSIVFDGEEVTDKGERELTRVRRRIGMLFQGAALFDSITVRENVAYGLREHLRMNEHEIAERVAQSLQFVGLPGIEDAQPNDLSGGMKKRVGLARAVAVRPEVLLYDEPTTGLDPINTMRINRLIMHLKKTLDITSIVVTHDMSSAFMVSDRMVMIDQGRVIHTGTPDEFRDSDKRAVRDFIEGTAPDEMDPEALEQIS